MISAVLNIARATKQALEDLYAVVEVQNSLLMQIAMDVMQLQIMAGNIDGAQQLADKFKMASEVLEAYKTNRNGESDEEE